MVSQELLQYVRTQLAAGYTRDALRQTLLSSGGWSAQDVADAFAAVDAEKNAPQQNMPQPNGPVSDRPQPQTSAPEPQQPRSRARWPIIFALIVALLVIAGGAAAYVVLVKNAATPTQMLQKAFTATERQPSFSFAATTTVSALDNASTTPHTSTNLSLAFGGSVDRHNASNPAANIALSGTFSDTMASGTLSGSGAVRLMLVNKKVYFNLTNATASYTPSGPPDLAYELSAAMVSGLAQTVENRWLEVDASSSPLSATTSPALAADERDLVAYLQTMSYVTMSQNAGPETVNGVKTDHLKFTLTFEQQLADILSRITRDQSTLVSNGAESLRAPSTQLAALAAASAVDASSTAMIESSFDRLVGQQVSIDVWVGASDSLIYQFELEPLTVTNSGVAATISFQAAYSNWGKTFSITPPDNAEPLQKFLQNAFGGIFGTSTASSSLLFGTSTAASGSATGL